MAVLTAFRDRLLDLVPIYSKAGQAILHLPMPAVEDRAAAFALAGRVSAWLLDALAVAAEHEPDLSAIAGNARTLPAPADPTAARRWHELSTDLAVIAESFPSAAGLPRLALCPRAVFGALAPAQAADEVEDAWPPAAEDLGDVGRAAADALYARAEGPDAVALEARAVLAAMAPDPY